MRAALIAAIFLALSFGCSPPASEGGFDSAAPGAKLYAILDAARLNDRSAIPQLIEQLDSDDPVVRFAAINTLEQLTGESFGYRYYDDTFTRREAIARWVDAVNKGAFNTIPATSAAQRTNGTTSP